MLVKVSPKSSLSDDSGKPPGHDRPDHILLVYSQVESQGRGTKDDLLSDLETIETAQAITHSLTGLGYPVTSVPCQSAEDVVLVTKSFDPLGTLVFNLIEALPDLVDGESIALRPLEEMGFLYLGNTSDVLDACRDKVNAKKCLMAHGVATAPYQMFETGKEPITVPLPAIVKPVREDGSVGITRDAVVTDQDSLRRCVTDVINLYKQPAMAELFLPGREFNLTVWGNDPPEVLPLAETNFGNCDTVTHRLLHFESKWVEGTEDFRRFTVDCPAQVDSKTARAIRKLALEARRAMGCRDYMRLDIREKDGKYYVLDMNPNPGLSISGGFAFAARAAGYDYPHMIQRLVDIGWRRALSERLLMTA